MRNFCCFEQVRLSAKRPSDSGKEMEEVHQRLGPNSSRHWVGGVRLDDQRRANRWVTGSSNVVTCSYTSTCYFYDHERALYILVLDSDARGYVHYGHELDLNAAGAAVKLFKEAPGAGNPTWNAC